MSDYLWDGKGEPDEGVARLEALLSAFAHEPRPLELPAEAVKPGPRPARLQPFASRLRAPRLFAPAALAAAAALVVAAVLIASAILRARVANVEGRAAESASSRPKDERAAPRGVERGMLEPPPGAVEPRDETPPPKVKDGKAEVESLPRGGRRREDLRPALASRRRQKVSGGEAAEDGPGAGEGLNLGAMRAGFGGSALVENARLLTKEQLVYALRLTGAKLRDVREKAQGSKAEVRPYR